MNRRGYVLGKIYYEGRFWALSSIQEARPQQRGIQPGIQRGILPGIPPGIHRGIPPGIVRGTVRGIV